jgi:hypothetical protein
MEKLPSVEKVRGRVVKLRKEASGVTYPGGPADAFKKWASVKNEEVMSGQLFSVG